MNVYKVLCSRCASGCEGELAYDGSADRIFNFTRRSLFTYSCLLFYSALFDRVRISFSSFSSTLQTMYSMHKQRFVNPRTFEAAWVQFNIISDYNYKSILSCKRCEAKEPSARAYVLDATSLSFESSRSHVDPNRFPTDASHASVAGWVTSGRTLFDDPTFRSLLMAYAADGPTPSLSVRVFVCCQSPI